MIWACHMSILVLVMWPYIGYEHIQKWLRSDCKSPEGNKICGKLDLCNFNHNWCISGQWVSMANCEELCNFLQLVYTLICIRGSDRASSRLRSNTPVLLVSVMDATRHCFGSPLQNRPWLPRPSRESGTSRSKCLFLICWQMAITGASASAQREGKEMMVLVAASHIIAVSSRCQRCDDQNQRIRLEMCLRRKNGDISFKWENLQSVQC